MSLSSDDRKTFSLKIVSADEEIAVFTRAKAQLQVETTKLQKLDDGNKNLFDTVNALVNQYQVEFASLDGIVRSTFNEQNIQDAAAVKLQNYFYPNDTSITVPSLSSNHNVWVKTKPFARTFAVGKTYVEVYSGSQTKEGDLINAALALITSASSYSDIENTTGMHVISTGSCSDPLYTDQTSCTLNGGTWTPGPDQLASYTAVQTLKSDLVTAINAVLTFLNTEVTQIVTTDKDTTNAAQNTAAINDINNVITPAINTWLGYTDFHITGAVNAGNFNSFNSALLAPTKLHSAQLTALQTALNSRLTYIATRVSQLTTTLGSITQDMSTGDSTSTGLYGKRYGFLLLRLDILNGSLNKLFGMKSGLSAQDNIISSIRQNKITYLSILPTSALLSPGNDTKTIQVAQPALYAVGDTVFIMAEGQEELQRAIKSITGTAVVLNDIVPLKYKTLNKLRIYKDIS